MIVIVDVLVFSTSVATVVAHGSRVMPVATTADAEAMARKWGAREIPGRGRPTPEGWSHSPVSLAALPAGLSLTYRSDNGAMCCTAAAGAGALLVGCLANAAAAAEKAAALAAGAGRPITVVACGERWEEGTLRPCLADELGAGAILAALPGSKSVEAETAAALFRSLHDRIAEIVWDSASGRELRDRGYGGDVAYAARLDQLRAVPVLSPEGWLE